MEPHTIALALGIAGLACILVAVKLVQGGKVEERDPHEEIAEPGKSND